jgi:ubiquinone biosynthesis protein UbiJ
LTALPRIQAEAATTARAVGLLQQDVRMIRAAINDLARTNVTVGEIEVLHAEVDQLRADVQEHATRLHILEHQGPSE